MKPLTIALATVLAGFAANSARADHPRVSVDVGINIGSNQGRPVYVDPAPVYVAPAPIYYAPPQGCWELVTTKVWVPARWVEIRDQWGCHQRVLEPGYFSYRTERVWVDGRGYRSDRGYGYDDGYRSDRGYGYNDNRRGPRTR